MNLIQKIDEPEKSGSLHVDDFIYYGDRDKYARWVLMHFRLPAMMKGVVYEFMKAFDCKSLR